MIDALRLVASMPVLVASSLLDSDTLFNLGAIVAGSSLRRHP